MFRRPGPAPGSAGAAAAGAAVRPPVRPEVAVVAACSGAVAFGVVMAVVHGSQGGVRATIGNLSAPWLLVAFAAGASLGRRAEWRGALSGVLVTVLALSGFYVTNIWVLGITGHGLLGDLGAALASGAYYIRLGVLSGPVMGALGSLWRRRRSGKVGLVATGLLVCEPLAWVAYYHGLPATWGFLPVAIAESAVGLLLSVAVVAWLRRTAAS